MSLHYLAAAANEMIRVMWRHRPPEKQDLSDAANIGCNALEDLIDDPEFVSSVERLAQFQRENEREYHRILDDLEHFKDFLRAEKRLLLKYGLNEELVNRLLDAAEGQISAIREHRINLEQLHDAITRIRREACGASETIQDELAQRRRTQIILYTLGAAVVIAANAAPIASGFLLPIGVAISGGVGSFLINQLPSDTIR